MKVRLALTAAVFAVAAVVMIGAAARDSRAQAQTPAQTPADYIVVFQDWFPDANSEIDRLERLQNFQAGLRFSTVLTGFAARLTPGQVTALQRLPFVQFITPDYEVQAIGSVGLASGETAPPGTRRIEAATTTTTRQASTVNVAVIDTGIQLNHPDLNAAHGKNCVNTSAQASDDNGHGTHVAGTIGARNTGSGVVGVAPGTTQYAVKVLNSGGSGSWSQVICGIDWVTANASTLNIKVVNMSLGGGGSNDNNCGNSNSDALHKAICNSVAAGVTYVVAAGNSSRNFSGSVPAAYPEVLTVTAMTDTDGQGGAAGAAPTCRSGEADDRYASYSNYAVSSTEINHTIAGPGTCVYSTWLSSGYNTISGTSMATPHVAGSVALCYGDGGSAGPCAALTPAQVVQKMRADALARTNAGGYGFTGVSGRTYGNLVANGTPAPATPDYIVSATPASRTVAPGSSTSYTVTVTGGGGYNTPVDLTLDGLPANTSASFSPATVTPSGSGVTSTLDVTTTGATPLSESTLTITGTSGANTRTAQVTLSVANTPPADFTLTASPSSRTLKRPTWFGSASTTYTVTLTSQGGYNLPVALSVSGQAAGWTPSFSPASVTPTSGGATSTLRITVTRSSTRGTRTLTITGVGSDNKTKTAQVTLTVN